MEKKSINSSQKAYLQSLTPYENISNEYKIYDVNESIVNEMDKNYYSKNSSDNKVQQNKNQNENLSDNDNNSKNNSSNMNNFVNILNSLPQNNSNNIMNMLSNLGTDKLALLQNILSMQSNNKSASNKENNVVIPKNLSQNTNQNTKFVRTKDYKGE